jgi:beta-lactam-binding protein with PASTA domain
MMQIKKVIFWSIIAFLSFIFGVILMNFVIMPFIVRKGDIVTVPDVTEMKLEEAKNILKSMKLEPYIELYDFDPTVPENYVYKQNPPPGTELKVSRRIELWVSKGQKKIEVPYLIGLPLVQAENLLHRFKLQIADVESIESDSLPPGKVIETIPKANTKVNKNTAIKIFITKATKEEGFPMPNLFGRNLSEIEKPIMEMGLVIGNIKYIESENGNEGEIILQSPQPGVLISSGDTISLVVTSSVSDTLSSETSEPEDDT